MFPSLDYCKPLRPRLSRWTFRACSNRFAAPRYLLASSSPSLVSQLFFLFSYAFFFHCLPSACPAFACVSHPTEASPMARASVLGYPGGAKIVTGFEGEGKAWRDLCRRKRPGERGENRNLLSAGPPSISLGWRKETQAKAGWARGQCKIKGVENEKLKPRQA